MPRSERSTAEIVADLRRITLFPPRGFCLPAVSEAADRLAELRDLLNAHGIDAP